MKNVRLASSDSGGISATPTGISEVRARIEAIGRNLGSTLSDLAAELPGNPSRGIDLARRLRVNTNLAHRLATAMQKADPLEVFLSLPGPALLVKVADTAQKNGVSTEICDRARNEAANLESLIQSIAGNRSSIDAMVSEWVPQAREQIATAARQTVFRGMRQIMGVSARLDANIYVFHPNDSDGNRFDCLYLRAIRGIERLKESGKLTLSLSSRLEGRSAVGESEHALLHEFCTQPPPTFDLHGPPERSVYTLQWDDTIGRGSIRDIVTRDLHRNMLGQYNDDPAHALAWTGDALAVPSSLYALDVLFHRDIFHGSTPHFRVQTTGVNDVINPNDPLTDHYRVPMECSIQSIGTGDVPRTALAELPVHGKLLSSQLAEVGWSIDEFRAFRVRIEYPLFDTLMQLIIPLPPRPGSSASE